MLACFLERIKKQKMNSTTTVAPQDQTEAEASQEAIDQAVAAWVVHFTRRLAKTRVLTKMAQSLEPRAQTTTEKPD